MVDGGLSNPVPNDVVRKMGADIVIAVNLNTYFFQNETKGPKSYKDKLGVYGVANNTINILRHHLARYCTAGADLVIIPKIAGTSWAKFTNGEEIIKEGEAETRLVLPKIKDLIQDRTQKRGLRKLLPF